MGDPNNKPPYGNYSDLCQVKKSFLLSLYGHLLCKNLEIIVLRNLEMLQCKYFFLTRTRNMFVEKIVKFLAVLPENIYIYIYIYFAVISELRFVKWVRFFAWNCIVKWLIFFSSFCWLWCLLLENLKLKNNFRLWGFK